jgi:hypothetical protein
MAKKKAKPSKPVGKDLKKKEDEEIVVLCFKVLMMPRPPVPGCSKVPCSDCGQPVWISPATAAHMVDKKHRICCAECVANDPDPDIELMPPSEGQIAEIVSTDPTITPAKIRRIFPASNPDKRRAALEDLLRRTKRRKRLDN